MVARAGATAAGVAPEGGAEGGGARHAASDGQVGRPLRGGGVLGLGGASQAPVLAQEATLNATKATLPNLQKQLAQQRILLTALVGRFPSQEVSQTFSLTDLHLPQDLPLSLPSKLVEQRPDIQASQAQHAAIIGASAAARAPGQRDN